MKQFQFIILPSRERIGGQFHGEHYGVGCLCRTLSYYIITVATNTTVAAMMRRVAWFAVMFFIMTVGIGMMVPDTFDRNSSAFISCAAADDTDRLAVVAVFAHRHLERLEALPAILDALLI
jgi:hypothetical protein